MPAWIAFLLAALLAAGPAGAEIVDACYSTRLDPTVPLHPSAHERIGLRLHFSGRFFPGLDAVARASVHNGVIDLDVVVTDAPEDFPGYRPVGDLYFDVADDVGPLAPGVYPIHVVLRHETSTTGQVLCTPPAQSVTVGATAGPVTERDAIEFFNAARDRHFVTSNPDEIAALDAGRDPGWTRTGQAFRVYDDSDGRGLPVCRFVAPVLDAHVISVDLGECAGLQSDPAWIQEGDHVAELGLPHSLTGACQDGMLPVYRLWNPRNGDHRWTVDAGLRAALVAAGWISEGYGDAGAAICAPAA